MNKQLINLTYHNLTKMNLSMPICPVHVTKVKNDLIKISKDIETSEKYFSNELFRLKDLLFRLDGFINSIIFGEVVAILKYLADKCNNPQEDMWSSIHPQIERVSKQLFIDGHFSNAAEDAFIEINDRVKKLFHELEPSMTVIPDGCDVMNKVFATGDKAMIEVCDRSTQTGVNIHEGTRFMLAGAMSALRNPKAHSNSVVITKEECIRRLMFASMLMYKIDEAVTYSRIAE